MIPGSGRTGRSYSCVCAFIFRREAINSARWKLTGGVSRGVADTLASVTSEDLVAAANEMEGGSGAWAVLSYRSGVRARKAIELVHSGQSWTIYNNRSTRMVAISCIIQMEQPLFRHNISPADIHSPIVMTMVGVYLGEPPESQFIPTTSKNCGWLPETPLRLPSTTLRSTLCCRAYCVLVLRTVTVACMLGRMKGYVGMTEEERRLSLHCHLLEWVFGYNDFASFRNFTDKTPERYGKLANFLDRVIFNQVATSGDVHLAMSDVLDGVSEQSDTGEAPRSSDSLVRDPKERMPFSPCTYGKGGWTRCVPGPGGKPSRPREGTLQQGIPFLVLPPSGSGRLRYLVSLMRSLLQVKYGRGRDFSSSDVVWMWLSGNIQTTSDDDKSRPLPYSARNRHLMRDTKYPSLPGPHPMTRNRNLAPSRAWTATWISRGTPKYLSLPRPVRGKTKKGISTVRYLHGDGSAYTHRVHSPLSPVQENAR